MLRRGFALVFAFALVVLSSSSATAQRNRDEQARAHFQSGSAYFEISGNTDSTGSKATNMKLSKKRSRAVVNYLINQWEFKKARFKVVGNGPNKPLCDEKNPASEGVDLDACRTMNRSTRLAILSR